MDPTFTGNVTIAAGEQPRRGQASGGATTVEAINGVATFAALMLDQAGIGYTLRTSTSRLTAETTNPFERHREHQATQLVVTSRPPAAVAAGEPFGLTVAAEDSSGMWMRLHRRRHQWRWPANPGGSSLGRHDHRPGGATAWRPSRPDPEQRRRRLHAPGNHQQRRTDLHDDEYHHRDAGGHPTGRDHAAPGHHHVRHVLRADRRGRSPSGNMDPTYTGTSRSRWRTNPGGSSLGEHDHRPAVNGVATFAGLTLNNVGGGYTLRATTSGGLTPTTTSPITVTLAASQLVDRRQPPAGVTAGKAFGLVVTAKDPLGNIVSTFTGNVTVVTGNPTPAGAAWAVRPPSRRSTA